MPSLRRTLSSPVVRSSPYPASLSAGSSPALRTNGHFPRRSSGSETTGRRVLADIDWWRVTDGQHDADGQREERNHGQIHDVLYDAEGVVLDGGFNTSPIADLSADRPPLLLPSWGLEGFPTVAPITIQTSSIIPTAEFAALTIAPMTPPRGCHGAGSASSSLQSTPESREIPLEGLGLCIADSAFEYALPSATVSRTGVRVTAPLWTLRSHSFDYFSLGSDSRDIFQDSEGLDVFS